MKKVLVLGAGLVVKPLLDELLTDAPGVEPLELTLAALDVDRARQLLEGRQRAKALELDTADGEALRSAIRDADLVVSLLPADLHPAVARPCVELRVPLVTTSYVSEAMAALDDAARERGVLLLNEMGLDPGIDHLMAMEVIRREKAAGGRVFAFASYAGGLPAPSSNDNPLGYKLSWSPRGVLLAAGSPARYRQGGQVVELAHPYAGEPRSLEVPAIGELEIYPNRDSLPYAQHYGLEDAEDLYRGTLRYPGWRQTWSTLLDLGLLDREAESFPEGTTWAALAARRMAKAHPDREVLERLSWLGLLDDVPLPAAAFTDTGMAPLDLLADRLGPRLTYAEGEEDLVILEHHFGVERPTGERRRIVERLLVVGTAGDDSAMARTVGTPAALAARRILAGQVDLMGVQIPVHPQLVSPLLEDLAARGLLVEEFEAGWG